MSGVSIDRTPQPARSHRVGALPILALAVSALGGCSSSESSLTALGGVSSLTSTAGASTCVDVVTAPLNADVFVPRDGLCVIESRINGNVTASGALVVAGGRIEGNVDVQRDGSLLVVDGVIKGNIEIRSTIELAGARVEGNLIFRAPAVLRFSGEPTHVKGNLEFEANTVVSGDGDATIEGNAKCEGRVTDSHTGSISTTGNKEECPATF